MAPRFDLNGRVVLVTGAARGIGAEIARKSAQRGAKVALVGLEKDLLEELATELGGAAFFADVTDREGLTKAIDEAASHFGGIDVVVANAGVSPVGTLRGLRDSDWDRTIAVNLTGVWNTIRAAVPYVVERKGYILNVASQSAIAPMPMMIPYTAAKAGVDNMSRALRMELYPTGARVGTVYYSWVDTKLVRDTVDGETAQGGMGAPKFFMRRMTVEDAVDITMDGIEKRAQLIFAPKWVRLHFLTRGFSPVIEKLIARDPRNAKAIERGDTIAQAVNDPADAASKKSAV
ncbi:MAG: SDR family NAD(P)-dependent oxidoreductase [Solirubrobacteraceae bacterium]|nr:SDR family NAD(P)-dependent oxidoreductase [Solirubrobacteraceae bacterium]